jgi:hypothetical protein
VKPLLHAGTDAVDVLQLKAERNVRQVVIGDDGPPVRLVQIGPDLAEKNIWREADRAGQAVRGLTNGLAIPSLPEPTMRQGGKSRPLYSRSSPSTRSAAS